MQKTTHRILIIDDKPDNLHVLAALIKDVLQNVEVRTAQSAIEGLEIAKCDEPDVILLDIMMQATDGFDVCRKIKGDLLLKDVPIIIITALTIEKEIRIKALEAGAEVFLSKPFDEAELLAQIRTMLRIKEANDRKKTETERFEKFIENQTREIRRELEARIKKEKKFREDSENWIKTFNAIKDSIALLDNDNLIIECNEAFISLLGKPKEEIIGQPCYTLIHNSDNPIDTCPFFASSLSKTRETIEMIREGRVYEVVVDPIINKKGKVTSFVHILSDITHKNESELIQSCSHEALIKAKERAEESDRLKTAFLANMSHEIRTPMNGIMGFTEVLKDPSLTPENRIAVIDIIEKSGKRLFNLINDLIDISLIESKQITLNYSHVDVKSECESLQALFQKEAAEKKLVLRFIEPEVPFRTQIFTDRIKLVSIISNLLKNALKFTEHGEITFGFDEEGDMIRFFVKDTGIGIPVQKQELIFERFVQADNRLSRKYEGAGLGLSIAKAYIDILGGDIKVVSGEQTGTEFIVKLPMCNIKDSKMNDNV